MNYLPLHHWTFSISHLPSLTYRLSLTVSHLPSLLQIHVRSSAKVCTNSFPLERIMHDNSVRNFLFSSFLFSISCLLTFFIPLSLSRILRMCRHHYLSTPANPFISYFYPPRKGFFLYFCLFNLFYEWGEIIKGQVKATTGRTKIVFSQITFFGYNFDKMILFIHRDLF